LENQVVLLVLHPDPTPEPEFVNVKKPRNRFQGIDFARLGIETWRLLKRFTNSGFEEPI
jgi:hypothetical protein